MLTFSFAGLTEYFYHYFYLDIFYKKKYDHVRYKNNEIKKWLLSPNPLDCEMKSGSVANSLVLKLYYFVSG